MFNPQTDITTSGYCIDQLLGRISKEIGSDNADNLKKTASEIVQNCVQVYSDKFGAGEVGRAGTGIVSNLHKGGIPNGTTGLIYGQVQSGKTMTTISTLAMLSANKFQCFIVLTSDNTWLGRQTFSRFRTGLDGGPVVYHWDDWSKDPTSFGEQSLKDYIQDTGVVLISTKNIKHLENLLEVLKSANAQTVPGLIFDDEADNASLNTNEAKQARKGKKYISDSSIFEVIGKIRQTIPNHIYMQITATPQSLLLQSLDHRQRPAFCVLSKVGKEYMGGSLFFGDQEKSLYRCSFDVDELKDLKGGNINPGNQWNIPKGLRLALCCFFVGSIYKMQTSDNRNEKYSCLIHICYKRVIHKNIETVISQFVRWLDRSLREQESRTDYKKADQYLQEAYDELCKTASMPEFEELVNELKHKLRNAIPKVINADNKDKEPEYDPGMNILIGGNRLGRGVTIEGLMITYYGRDPKQKMMDTVHQHARMFGYRQKLKDVTRLFVPDHIFSDFSAIHESDQGMREVIGDNPKELSVTPVWVGQDLKPTRSNVLNPTEINAFTPGQSTFPRDPMWKKNEICKHTEELNQLLKDYDDDNIYYEVDIDFLIKVLTHIPSRPVPGSNWEDKRVKQALQAMNKEGISKGRLNVRTGKNRQGLGLQRRDSWVSRSFFTNEWIRYAQNNYPDVPTLIVGYEQGSKNKKWDDQPLYLPTLIFPRNKFVFMFNYSEGF